MSASEEVAAVGATQRFECQVVGYPSPIVTWYKDEVDITQDPRYNIHFDKQQGVIALTIREVLPTDEGCYQCRAQNSEGYATTTAYLVVRVDHGLSAGFKSMLVAEKLSEQESSRVQMSSAYKQRVIEEVITRYEESEKEVIEEKLFPPKVTYDHALSEGVQLKAGSTLYIEVGVAGIPFPSVTWKHGETQLREDARVTMEDDPSGYSYLKVKGTTREDEGIYKVMAENTVGKDEASFNVTVKGTPSAPRNLHIQEVYKDYIVIRWDAPEQDGGFPVTSYNIEKSLSGGTFMAVNQVLANEFEFKITRLYEGSEYMFRVSAQNKVGVGVSVTTDKPTKARLPFDPPGKPTDLKVTSVDKDAVGLSWDAPESDGGALVTSYIVERKDVSRASSMWAIAGTVDGTTRDLLVGKLFTGNCYHFRVFSENRVGPGEPATLDDGIVAKLPYDAPSPARNIRAVETNVDYIVLEWDPPESDGGTPLTSYVIEKRDSKRREFIYIADVGPDCTLFKAMRLFEGYEYFFRVFAENIVGPSEACTMETPARAKLPYDEPASPRSLRVTDYWTDFVTVQWEASDYDGGSPITGYIIEKRDAMRQSWIKVGNVGPDIDTFQVTNLFEGTDYVFRVFAENKVGLSLTAAELDKPQRAKMPYDAPLAPQSMTISDVTSESATVMWAPPANDGGAPLTGYVIEKRDAMRISWGVCGTAAPDANTFKVDGLIVGDNYFFRVSAENKVGRGEFVELIHPITAKMPYDKPGPPSNLRTTEVWNNYITIAWDVPEDDGGTPILGYHVELRDAMKAEFREVGKTPANITEFQVGCLEEGREYYFRIFACNKAGVGEVPSDLKPAVKAQLPYDRPSAPTALKVVGTGKGTISITWGLPSNEGGSPVTGYMIEASQAREHDNFKAVGTVEAATLEYTITDLIDGADYFVRVRAQNAAGLSEEAVQTGLPVCAREPRTAPDSPGSVTVTSVTSESVTITWSAPLSDGGAKVRSYTVEVREVGMTFSPAMEVDGNTLTATLPSLTPENAYEIQVFATNSEGPSKPASLAEPVKTEPAPAVLTPPSAPKALRVTEARSDAITITWEEPESDGGSPVTHYVVVIKDDTSTKKFRKAGRVEATTLSLTVTDKIKPGHEYNMVVYGENAAGVSNDGAELATPVMVPEPVAVVEEVFEEVVEMVESAPVQAAAPPKPKAVPAAPENARCDGVSSDGLTVVWDAPENDGGCPVIKYTIVMRDVEKKKFKPIGEVDGTTTSFTVDKVKSGHDYVIRVYAENEVGLSVESEISDAVKIPSEKAEDTVDAKGPAPEIVTAPEPVAVAEGETIRLTCKVKGNPTPEVTWLRADDTPLNPQFDTRIEIEFDDNNNLHILIIHEAVPSDTAEYTVKADNVHGSMSVTVKVVVNDRPQEPPKDDGDIDDIGEQSPPEIIIPPRSVYVDVGKPIFIFAAVAGNPRPNVEWFKGKTQFRTGEPDERVQTEYDAPEDMHFLEILDARLTDQGEYDMVVTNKAGSLSAPVSARVFEPIIKPPERKASLSLERRLSESKERKSLLVQEDTMLSSDESGTTTKVVRMEDTMTISDDGGVRKEMSITETSSTISAQKSFSEENVSISRAVCEELLIPEDAAAVEATIPKAAQLAPPATALETFAPVIEVAPEPISVNEGDIIRLTCRITGEPEPTITWFKDDQKLRPQEDPRVSVDFDIKEDLNILLIEKATKNDEGAYRLEVTNDHGTVSITVMVTVEGPAPREPTIEAAPEPVEFSEGDSITLSCKVSGTPAPEIKWYKDDHKIKSKDKRITTDFDATQDLHILTVKDAVRSDEGAYKIKVTNEKGSAQVSVMVTAKGGADIPKIAPTFQSVPEPVTVNAGEAVCLSVGVTAEPEAEVTWTKDDKKIKKKKKDAHVKMDYDSVTGVHFLEIKESTVEDSGTYVVTATNVNGTVSHTVSVTLSKPADKAPEFINKPGPVNAHEFDPVIISVSISGEPSVTWFKEGKPLKDTTARTAQDGDVFSLTIASASLLDAGEYTIAANNAAGGTFHTVNVSIEAATEKETEEEDKDLAVVEKLLPKINAEKEKLKDGDEMLFKAYPCLEDYSDSGRGVDLKKNDVVEVMDTEKDDEWLVRKQDDKQKVCYVPVEILLGRKKHDDSSGDEELTDQAEAFPIYQAIADYNPPPPPDHLKLKEGQFVEVLDKNNPERWLCRTKPTKNKEPQTGWVPPSYLEAKRGDVRTPREQFREDVLKLDNKEQEAAMKRRYALEDLWESERDYIRDLSFAMETYYPKFDGELPDLLKGKKEVVFSSFSQIKNFHGDLFLADLLKCTSSANSVGQCFLDHTEDFQMYVPYYLDREPVSALLNTEEAQKFIKDHDKSIGNLGESKLSLPQYLARPTERITEYINILRDFMKYSGRAGEEVDKAEAAIKMLLELQRKAEDDAALTRIVGYPGDLAALGPINRHDDFMVWDSEATGKGKERHLFLFNDKLMLTKKKKPKNPGDPVTYEFKSLIDLPEVQLNEHLEDERRFALCYTDKKTENVTFQARNVHVKQAWCDDLRRYMKCLAEDSDVSAYHSAVEEEPTAPSFTASLKPVMCTEGEPVRLTCQLSGHPVPDITWSYNGVVISQSADYKFEVDGDNFSLFLPKAGRDMSGKYSITATNASGTVTCDGELAVEPTQVAPSFKSKLKDVITTLGEQAGFQVRVSGVPEPEVVWTHNGEEVKSGDRFKFLFEDEETHVLLIENITTADEGTYKVKATNALGKKSSSANLTTRDTKFKVPSFTSQLKDATVAAGTKARFSCKVTGQPEPEVMWLHDGEVVKPNKSINKMSHDGDSVTLTLKSVTQADAGKYTCRVTNTAGTSDSVATLTVEGGADDPAKLKPKFTGTMKDVDAMKGEKVQFHCVVDGNPRPVLTWYHNHQPLVETERIMIYTLDCEHTLVLTTTMMADEGEYTAKAVTELGEVSTVAKLFMTEDTMKEPEVEMAYSPSFTKKIANQSVPLGMIARFTAKCIGVPDPDITWQKEGVTMEGSDHVKFERDGNQMTLMISGTQVEDAGTYTCIVTNSAGENKCNATLVIETPTVPEPVRASVDPEDNLQPPVMPMDKPYLTDIDVSNFQLSWGPAILPPKAKPTLIRYCLEQCKLPGSDWITIQSDLTKESTLVSEFDPLKDYMYRIKAYNEGGFSDPTNPTSVYARNLDPSLLKREPIKDKLPPRAVRDKPVIFDVSHESLKLSWQSSEIPSYAVQTPITYIVERRCPPNKNWIEVGVDIAKIEWTMLDYKPAKDYMFRIRAHNEYGSSDPSMSSTLFSTPAEEEKPKKKEPKEEPKAKVKPRTIWDKPDIYDITSESCMLKWKASSLPNYAEQTPIHYVVEKREPPNTDWIRLTADCQTTSYQVTKITRKRDYYFRIRATNEHGTSEPSMPSMLRREEVDTALEDAKKKKKEVKEEENIPTRRVPLHMRIIPEFIGNTEETQYGVEGRTAKIFTYIRGYPEPTIMWFVRGDKIELGSGYNCTLSPQGELVLEVDKFSWGHVGDYKVYVENEFGSASMIIKLDMADPPTFLEPMKDQVMYLRRDGKLECRVHGIPYPTVTFKHDWRVIANGHRVKISREDYDHWTLNVNTAIYMDEGMYECVAENLAGKVYCTATVKVNEKAGLRDIRFNPVPIEDYFHIIDELGRGAYGVVRRVIDKNSGNQYAAKFLRFPDHLVKSELETELEMLTLLDHPGIIQLIDGYEDKKRLMLVMEVVTGGELLQRLVKDDTLTESEVAFYIRQLLLSVEHMHAKSVVHLDLKLENLFLAQSGSDELKLIDFGFARRWNPRLPLRVKYATPEYAAPEVAAGDDVTPAADMWSVGVIVYIMLSGASPFHKGNARDTLLNIKEGKFEFDNESFANISAEAKNFITRCLTKDPKKRINATEAIDHEFIELAHHRGLGDRINLEKIRGYMFRRKWERGQDSVKTFAQPRPLADMMAALPAVVPPGLEVEVDVPIMDLPDFGATAASPGVKGPASDQGSVGSGKSLTLEAGAAGMLQVMGPMSLLSGAPSTVGSGASSEWGREYEDEDTWYEWSTSYQTGPDTFLIPKSDSGLSMRLASYRRAGSKTKKAKDGPTAGSSRMSMRERRDLRDLDKAAAMADDDGELLTKRHGKRSVWLLKSMIETADGTSIFPPIFKEKIRDKAYNVGDACTLRVHVIGNPTPAVSWYRNDELLTDGGRVRTSHTEEGRYSLTIISTKPNDFGVYKCIARNKHGKVTCRARMLLGDCPGRPGRPHVTKVSDSEIYQIWEEPETDGNSYILAYRVDWHRPGDERWTTATYSIDEQALVKGLVPDTTYRFRIAAINKFGTSPYSWASVEIRTKCKGAANIDIDSETKRILLRSRQAQSRPSPDPSPATSPAASVEDLSKLSEDKDLGMVEREVFLHEKTNPREHLEFGSVIWKGRFTMVRNVKPKEGRKVRRVAKIMPYDLKRPEDSLREYDMLKNVRQEHIVRLYESYQNNDSVVLVFEKLYGENVARSLSLKNRYSEQQVSAIMKQVLDALQFLHHRGIVHLNLQPDNVIMVSRRRMDIKLIDFGRAREINSYEGERVERLGTAEFMAPEKVAKENVGVAADVWGVGLLGYILLSGTSPFQGQEDEDTYSNVLSVRYDAHQIYHNVTKYALKFIYQTLKRNPKARLTTEECLEHRWLMLNTPMIKMRKAAIFPTEKLRLFEEDYIQRRLAGGTPDDKLMELYGVQDRFSDSEDEIFPKTD